MKKQNKINISSNNEQNISKNVLNKKEKLALKDSNIQNNQNNLNQKNQKIIKIKIILIKIINLQEIFLKSFGLINSKDIFL